MGKIDAEIEAKYLTYDTSYINYVLTSKNIIYI